MSAHTNRVSVCGQRQAFLRDGRAPPNDNTGGQVLLFMDEKDGFGPFRRVISHTG